MVKVVQELTVLLENRPGQLGELTQVLASNGINILGIGLQEGGNDFGVCRLVVDAPSRAIQELGSATMMVIDNPVLALRLTDKPGMLDDVARALARRKINIDYAYGSTSAARTPTLFMRVSDVKKAVRALGR